VLLQLAKCEKRFLTVINLTGEIRLILVFQHVVAQSGLRGKLLVTILACLWGVFSVNALMYSQGICTFEILTASRAYKWSLICVGNVMASEVRLVLEFAPALRHWAYEAFHVSPVRSISEK